MREQFFPSYSSSLDIPPYRPRYAPCSAVHPALSSCLSVPLDRFFAVFKWMLPIYSVLHFAPAILFKWKSFIRDPGNVLVKSGLGSLRSSAFLGVFVIIYQSELTNMFTVAHWMTSTHQAYFVISIISIESYPNWSYHHPPPLIRYRGYHNISLTT